MKILAVSDEESPALWDYFVPGRLDGYDLILACGDLKAEYLSFLVTMSHARLLYVRGNHDGAYLQNPPDGCECIDDQFVVYNGVRILGLGGCRKYRKGPFQYTERQMRWRIAKLWPALIRCGGVDIVIAHAAPQGLGDRDDPAHLGFAAFRKLIEKWRPALFLHGHVHRRYDHTMPREHIYESTRIINVSDRCTLDFPEPSDANPKDHNRLIWKTHHREKSVGWDLELTPQDFFYQE